MAKPTREFSVDVGQKSMGVAGPDFIERDLDKLFAMFDPNKSLPTGEQGGIGSENMKPGAVTAEQTGALVSVDGVSNPGGDIDFVAGTGMEIIPDSQNKKITFAAKNESIIPGPHAETHRSGGSDPITITSAEMEAVKKHSLIYLGESIDYGEDIRAIAIDDDYVYVGGITTNKVYKLNKSDLSKVAESADYGGHIYAIAIDDDYVYVGGYSTQKVYKLNKSNLSKVAESADYGGTIWAIAIDDNYVYIGGYSTNKVYKLNKSNLSKVAESDDNGETINTIAVDYDYVYIGGKTTNKVYKLNKSNLSKVAESDSYGGTIWVIAVDYNYVYIGGAKINRVYKLLNLVSLKN